MVGEIFLTKGSGLVGFTEVSDSGAILFSVASLGAIGLAQAREPSPITMRGLSRLGSFNKVGRECVILLCVVCNVAGEVFLRVFL